MRMWIAIGVLGLCSCSHPVVFQGQGTLAVTGTPPPPPAVAEATVPPRVEVRDNKIEIHEKIQFDFDKATIVPASFGLMNEIASVIAKNPQIKRLRIEGHASAEGDPDHNKALSGDRAKVVMKYLVDHGARVQELTAIGYGADRPIADNATEQGREQNRRVEFLIVEQDVTHKAVAIDAKTGAETVVEEKHETLKAPDLDAAATHRDPRPSTTPKAVPHKKGG
jgi:outer membrane protein OmpA-like peptidoglycan-associated protein